MGKKILKTPKGKAKFVNIGKPDVKGKYRLALAFDPADHEAQQMMTDYSESELDFGKQFRGKPLTKIDKSKNESGDLVDTGLHLINFTGSQFKPAIFDSNGDKIEDENFDIGWGSIIRVSFTLKEYDQDGNKGLARYIKGIQVINLIDSGVTADACGFGKEDGGFTAIKASASSSAPVDADVNWDE
jgi:hypothetical protein